MAEEIQRFQFGNSTSSTECDDDTDNTSIPMTTLNSEGLLDVNSMGFPRHLQIPGNQLEICNLLLAKWYLS